MLDGLPNEWGGVILSHDGRPASTLGASITPAQNAYGSYASVIAGASVTFDVWEIEIMIQGIAVSAAATDSLTTIGIDPAGGSSFTDWIPDLLTGYANAWGNTIGGGITYRFPMWCKAGTSIGAKGAINRATVGTQRVSVKLYGQPSRSDLVRRGMFCRSFGATLASSNGTTVTAGTVSEGTFAQLGSNIADSRLWFWNVGIANSNDAVHNNGQVFVDLAIGSGASKKTVIANQIVMDDTTEQNYANYRGAYGLGASGDGVWARAQSASATTAYTAVAYGVGG